MSLPPPPLFTEFVLLTPVFTYLVGLRVNYFCLFLGSLDFKIILFFLSVYVVYMGIQRSPEGSFLMHFASA